MKQEEAGFVRRSFSRALGCLVGLTLTLAGHPAQALRPDANRAIKGVGTWRVSPGPNGNEPDQVYLVNDPDGVQRDSCRPGPDSGPVKAALVVGCAPGRFEVWLHNLPSRVQLEGEAHATVSLAFDSEPKWEMHARVNRISGDAIYFVDPVRFVAMMRSHTRLFVSFMPSCLTPQQLTFDIRGLDAVLGELSRHGCSLELGVRK